MDPLRSSARVPLHKVQKGCPMAAARSIASLSLSFGLVAIPVKLYSATESSGAVKFNLLTKDGARVKQQSPRRTPASSCPARTW